MVDVATIVSSLDGPMPQADWLGPTDGGRLVLLNELGELLQWPCHDDSTMNTVVSVPVIITLVYCRYSSQPAVAVS